MRPEGVAPTDLRAGEGRFLILAGGMWVDSRSTREEADAEVERVNAGLERLRSTLRYSVVEKEAR